MSYTSSTSYSGQSTSYVTTTAGSGGLSSGASGPGYTSSWTTTTFGDSELGRAIGVLENMQFSDAERPEVEQIVKSTWIKAVGVRKIVHAVQNSFGFRCRTLLSLNGIPEGILHSEFIDHRILVLAQAEFSNKPGK